MINHGLGGGTGQGENWRNAAEGHGVSWGDDKKAPKCTVVTVARLRGCTEVNSIQLYTLNGFVVWFMNLSPKKLLQKRNKGKIPTNTYKGKHM